MSMENFWNWPEYKCINRHKEYVDQSDDKKNLYSSSTWPWKLQFLPLVIQNYDTGEGPNPRERKGASNPAETTWEERQSPPNSQLNNDLTNKQEWNTSVQNVTCSCVLVQVSRYVTPNCLYETNLTLNWKSRAHRHKSMLPLLMPVFQLCNNWKGANVNNYPS